MRKWISNIRYIQSQKALLKDTEVNMLKLFVKHQCIFFHIPKTGGISVTKSLFGNVDWGHRDVNYYKAVFGKKRFAAYYKFTIVRNPYDRLYSAYTFLKKGGKNEQDRTFANEYLSHYISFEHFVKEGFAKNEIKSWVHFKPQTDYLTDKKGRLCVDFIGKFENLHTDFQEVCKQLRIRTELLHLNKTSEQKEHQVTPYNEELKAIVYQVYQKDFHLLNYPK